MADEIVDTSFGRFLIDPADLIGSTTKAGTLWDGPGFLQPIAKEFARFGEEGTTILDVGANIGTFSVYCASKGAWRVVAVEPVPSTLQRLKANLDLNRERCAGVVIPVGVAAYDRTTRMALAAPLDPHNRGAAALVPTADGDIFGVRLDSYRYVFGRRVSLIKIDAQGCDAAAIYGLVGTIERDRPGIVFEWEPELAEVHGTTLGLLLAFLGACHYTVRPWPGYDDNYLAVPL